MYNSRTTHRSLFASIVYLLLSTLRTASLRLVYNSFTRTPSACCYIFTFCSPSAEVRLKYVGIAGPLTFNHQNVDIFLANSSSQELKEQLRKQLLLIRQNPV